MGHPERAADDYGEAVKLEPDFADAYDNRAHAYWQMKEYGKAMADLEKCAQLGGRGPGPSPGARRSGRARGGGEMSRSIRPRERGRSALAAPRQRSNLVPCSMRERALLQGLLAAVLVAATLLVYLPAMRAGFVWDDDTFLTANPLIKAHDGLYRFWFTRQAPDYFPLTSSMLWVEWRLWGMDAAGYHVVNILLHALSAALIWRVLARLKIPGAWFAGLLFAVHPVCAESVAWITEGKNTLPLPLFLASLLVYLKFDERTGDWEIRRLGNSETPCSPALPMSHSPNFPISEFPLYLLSVTLFLLGLLAKTSIVMLPAVLLLCAWWRRSRISRRDLVRSAPFFALSLALGLVTVWFQYHRAISTQVVRTEGLSRGRPRWAGRRGSDLYKAVLLLRLCFVYPRWRDERVADFVPAGALSRGGAGRLLVPQSGTARRAAAAFRAGLLPADASAGAGVPEHLLHALFARGGPLAVRGAGRADCACGGRGGGMGRETASNDVLLLRGARRGVGRGDVEPLPGLSRRGDALARHARKEPQRLDSVEQPRQGLFRRRTTGNSDALLRPRPRAEPGLCRSVQQPRRRARATMGPDPQLPVRSKMRSATGPSHNL